ncbi:hypothetical protein HDU97_001053 [Phlyctochytrium planicorne]|nr:hypothetical protein HDU97_001053 [Phlyctochytrium planicorne]
MNLPNQSRRNILGGLNVVFLREKDYKNFQPIVDRCGGISHRHDTLDVSLCRKWDVLVAVGVEPSAPVNSVLSDYFDVQFNDVESMTLTVLHCDLNRLRFSNRLQASSNSMKRKLSAENTSSSGKRRVTAKPEHSPSRDASIPERNVLLADTIDVNDVECSAPVKYPLASEKPRPARSSNRNRVQRVVHDGDPFE